MASSVYDYIASVHDYGQVVVACEGVRDVVGSCDVRVGGGYASIGVDVDASSLRSGCLNIKGKCEQTHKQQSENKTRHYSPHFPFIFNSSFIEKPYFTFSHALLFVCFCLFVLCVISLYV
jgi:hypothetical protein